MELCGIDIILDVPPRVPVIGIILDRMRRLWPQAYFVDAEGSQARPITDEWVAALGESYQEFLIYQNRDSYESWRSDGAIAANFNQMLHFILESEGESLEGIQELTVACDERTEMIDRLLRDLEFSFRNFYVPYIPKSAA